MLLRGCQNSQVSLVSTSCKIFLQLQLLPTQVSPPWWVAVAAAALPWQGSGTHKTISVLHSCPCRSALKSMAKFYLKGRKGLKIKLTEKQRRKKKTENGTVKSAPMWIFFKCDCTS